MKEEAGLGLARPSGAAPCFGLALDARAEAAGAAGLGPAVRGCAGAGRLAPTLARSPHRQSWPCWVRRVGDWGHRLPPAATTARLLRRTLSFARPLAIVCSRVPRACGTLVRRTGRHSTVHAAPAAKSRRTASHAAAQIRSASPARTRTLHTHSLTAGRTRPATLRSGATELSSARPRLPRRRAPRTRRGAPAWACCARRTGSAAGRGQPGRDSWASRLAPAPTRGAPASASGGGAAQRCEAGQLTLKPDRFGATYSTALCGSITYPPAISARGGRTGGLGWQGGRRRQAPTDG